MKTAYRLSLVFALLLAGCTTTTPKPPIVDDSAKEAALEATAVKAIIPSRPFPADSFLDLLIAEFAVNRQQYNLALGYYMQQASSTRDPAVAARASRLAQFLKADNASLDAALLWVELEPENLEAHYTAAAMLSKKRRVLEALPHMRYVLDHGGKTNFQMIAASGLRLPASIRQQLEQAFDLLLQTYPTQSQLFTGKALLQQTRGDLEGALSSIQQGISHNSDDLHAIVIEARLLQQLKRGNEAFTRLESVVTEHPNNRRLRLQYARLLMGRDINEAKTQFEYLLKQTPRDPDLLLSLALISKETQQFDQAEQYFTRLLNTGKRDNEARYYLAQLAEERNDLETAIDHYASIPMGNDYVAATNRIAELHIRLGNISDAQGIMRERRQNAPELAAKLYLAEAELLLSNRHLEESLAILDEALLAFPENDSFLYVRSMVHEKRHHFDLMEADLRRLINKNPDNAVALNALGYTLANRGEKLNEAQLLIQRALTLKPDDPAILDSLGWVEFRLGNLTMALELLRKAYKAYPDPEVAAHLGEVLWQSNQRQKARQVWLDSLKEHPDSPPLRETIERLMPGDSTLSGS